MAIRIDDVDLDRDRALVRRFQAGDAAAFDELYSRYRHRLERFCLKRVGDHHAAEEVAQEAFTRALAALPAFGGERRFYPWVSVIASRLCVDHYRNQARSAPAPQLDCTEAPGGEDAVVDAVDREQVSTAMARLGPRYQDVLRLREVEGWSYRRIADHYRVPIGTIETLLFRARRALRREFDIIDGAGLAAIPLIGRLVHGLARARDRLAPVASFATTPASLAVAATAAVAAVAISAVPGGRSAVPEATHDHVATRPAPIAPARANAEPVTAAASTAPGPATAPLGAPTAVAGEKAGPVAGIEPVAASISPPATGAAPVVPSTPTTSPAPATQVVPALRPSPTAGITGLLASGGQPVPARGLNGLLGQVNNTVPPGGILPAAPPVPGVAAPLLGVLKR